MISTKDLANMSIENLTQAIETRHEELALLYQTLAAKSSKQTIGEAYLADDRVADAEYWFNVGKTHRNILAEDYNLNSFEESILFFKSAVTVTQKNSSNTMLLKTARDKASKDCAWHILHIRKRVKELKQDPIFKLILQREPNPRPYNLKVAPVIMPKN